jgi:aromatic-L-amino-acid decarboxylase
VVHDLDLELSSEQMRELLDLAGTMVVDYLSRLDEKSPEPSEDRSDFEPLPQLGVDAEQLLDEVRRTVIEPAVNTASGSYQAYIPGGGLFASAVAHFIGSATNRYVGVTGIAPGAVRIEQTVIRWLNTLVGYDDKSLGFLTSGGSLANFSALVTARCDRLPENFLSGTIYVSDQAHSSIQKAATLAGFPSRNIREIPSDSRLRLPIAPLHEQIHADRRAGYTPF